MVPATSGAALSTDCIWRSRIWRVQHSNNRQLATLFAVGVRKTIGSWWIIEEIGLFRNRTTMCSDRTKTWGSFAALGDLAHDEMNSAHLFLANFFQFAVSKMSIWTDGAESVCDGPSSHFWEDPPLWLFQGKNNITCHLGLHDTVVLSAS